MGLVEEAIKAFPAPTFRPYQKGAVKSIAEAFESGKRVVLLEAPTGSGKSYINVSFCRLFKSFYATPQLTLISQIASDPLLMNEFALIKGRQNYSCNIDPETTVDMGLCVRSAGKVCDRFTDCEYWSAKLKAKRSNEVLTTLSYLIMESRAEESPMRLEPRELCVLDEAHRLAEHLIDSFSVTVSKFTVPRVLSESIGRELKFLRLSDEEVVNFCYRLSFDLESFIEGFELFKTTGEPSIEYTRDYLKAQDLLSKIKVFLGGHSEAPWVYWRDKTGALKIQPVYGSSVSEPVWSRADRFIISSATILDHQRFAREVGIMKYFKADEVCFVKVPSYFPPGNRPVFDFSLKDGVREHKEEWAPQALKALTDILSAWEGSNVAVHVPSYEDADWIYSNLPEELKKRCLVHTPEDREDVVELFKKERNKVFLAVAFREGQDWKGDICDAQVLWRVPYPEPSDARVEYRLRQEKDWPWYWLITLREVIQSYGRAVRSQDERKPYYVLDASFWRLLRRCRKSLPEWFKEALPVDWEKLP
jgi:Rad3-related DNA helicase